MDQCNAIMIQRDDHDGRSGITVTSANGVICTPPTRACSTRSNELPDAGADHGVLADHDGDSDAMTEYLFRYLPALVPFPCKVSVQESLALTRKLLKRGCDSQVIRSVDVVVVALVYMQRLENRDIFRRLSTYTAMCVCVLLANKYLEDAPFNNNSFAQLSGIELTDLNWLELFFLANLEWKVHVIEDEYLYARSAILDRPGVANTSNS